VPLVVDVDLAQLDVWLRRAATATTADDVICG
jgi:hypothetical protein